MASQQVIRVYHSTAALLPDGRVLSAGSGEGSNATAQLTAEIFSPPYPFDATGKLAPRPQITSVPFLRRLRAVVHRGLHQDQTRPGQPGST